MTARALTDREIQVVDLMCAGYRDKEIGKKLGISHRTVERIRSTAMIKLGAKNLAQAGYIWGRP